MNDTHYVIGIDEAGRGPLAGPLVVAGILTRFNLVRFRGIRDSKKLSAKQREEWFAKLTHDPKITWATARIAPKTIDRIHIARAANLGALRVFKKLAKRRAHVLLDGSLMLPKHISQKTIIRGDEKVPIIAAASIIAKVTRDRIMRQLHTKYPVYRFDIHKGYGTQMHRTCIRRFGYCPIHRASFTFRN